MSTIISKWNCSNRWWLWRWFNPQAASAGGSGGGSGTASGNQSGGSGNAGGNIDSKPEGNSGGDAPGYTPQYMGGGGWRWCCWIKWWWWFWRSPGGIGVQAAIAGPSTASPVGTPGPSGNGWFAGGGGGGGNTDSCHLLTTSNGGDGGGGDGFANAQGQNGTFSTGGGGGGSAYGLPGPVGPSRGGGGSGIVVVRYLIASGQSGTAKASGGSISFYGGKTIHTFTSTGNFVTPGSFSETVEYVAIGGGGLVVEQIQQVVQIMIREVEVLVGYTTASCCFWSQNKCSHNWSRWCSTCYLRLSTSTWK